MYQIEIDHLNKYFGSYQALQDIDISIPQGSFVALVGPSGCGKSTLLRTIAGLEKVSAGKIRITGRDVSGLPPRRRDVAMVFQSYALYPHMTVEKNMNFSMRLKRMGSEYIRSTTKDAATTLGLEKLLGRLPKALSGGQRQRVAMGRAIVRDPKVFLFDEPLSNLDAALRVRMRSEVRKLHERLQATSVYVTHDQLEAMTMADYIVVLRDGRVEQQGAPLELYDNPANRFVASFIGSPSINIVEATATEDGGLHLGSETQTSLFIGRSLRADHQVLVGFRPEHLSLEENPGDVRLDVRVEMIESTGSMSYITAWFGSDYLVVVHPDRLECERDDEMALFIAPEKIYLFDSDTEESICN